MKKYVWIAALIALGLVFSACKPEPEVKDYTVTFDANANEDAVTQMPGDANNQVKIKEGAKIPKPAEDPERDHYTFNGWYKEAETSEAWNFEIDTVTKHITLYAKWELEAGFAGITVTFNKNSHGESPQTTTQTVETGSKVTKPQAPVDDNWEFEDWYTDAECSADKKYDFDTVITSDHANFTLYAKWVQLHTVLFDMGGAGEDVTKKVKDGTPVEKPADPERDSFEFAGWYKDSSHATAYNFDDAVTGNLTLYAKWDEDSSLTYFDVKFHTDGGTEISDRREAQGHATAKPADPAKEGYRFAGWYSNDAFTGSEYNFESVINANLNLYAKWVQVFTVTFNLNDGGAGTAPAVQKIDTGLKAEKPADPTRAGYTFEGWFTAATEGTEYDFDDAVTANVTLYAQWTANSGDALVIDNPAMDTTPSDSQDGFTGTHDEGSASATFTKGAVRYMFPEEGIEEYDFVTLEYLTDGKINDSAVLKQGTTGSDYPRYGSDLPGIVTTLTTGTVEGVGSWTFAIKQCTVTPPGIALQVYSALTEAGTIEWTKVTFTKGVRYDISFDTNYSGGETIPAIKAVATVPIGALPEPAAREGYIFMGWVEGETSYGTSTVMPERNLSLKANWKEPVAVQPITVNFKDTATELTVIGAGGVVTPFEDGTGYSHKYGTAGYGGGWVKFSITFPEGVSLADYDTVTATWEGKAGGFTYKPTALLAGKPLPGGSFSPDPVNAAADGVWQITEQIQYTTGKQTYTYTINKAKAAELTGKVEFCFYDHSGNDVTFEVSNVQFKQNAP